MSFIARILFTGLMAVIPNQDGTEVTVLLLNVPHQHQLSDTTTLPTHKPLLLSRAGSCTGDCPTLDSGIAEFLYSDKSAEVALDSLELAVSGGGAWDLTGSDLSIRKGSTNAAELPSLVITDDVRGTVNSQPKIIPTTSTEREDISWIADLSQILQGDYTVASSFLSTDPPAGLVAARLRIRSGKVFTYSVAKIGGNVTPVHFERLDGQGSVSPYTQAIASWIGTDIEVTGDSIEIFDETFNEGAGRSMKLTPDTNGKVEIAVLNVPPFVPPASAATSTEIGKHFEIYYDLADETIDAESRLVPKPGAASGAQSYSAVTWQSVHPQTELWSELLNQLRMNIGRSLYELALCPPGMP